MRRPGPSLDPPARPEYKANLSSSLLWNFARRGHLTPHSHHTHHAIDAVEVTAHRMYHSIQLSGKKSRLSGKGSAKPHAYW